MLFDPRIPCLTRFILQGLWMKHVQAYLSFNEVSARAAKYEPFITAQAAAIVENAMNSTGGASGLWYAPNEGGAVFSGQSDTAALASFLSAAEVSV